MGNRNVKEIGCAEIESFLLESMKIDGGARAGKTLANMRSVLHTSRTWLHFSP